MALGITSASTGEGKSTHALAFARTAALAGEKVVLVDADLRRSGVSRLIEQSFCFTLQGFSHGRCTADEVVCLRRALGCSFRAEHPRARPLGPARTSGDFTNFIDHLKEQFAVVIIDLPPILGLAETIRLSIAADKVALIIRWGRTERQFVQFALDALRSAGVHASAAILNDIDLRAQHRRGYRDRTMVYGDENLYRSSPAITTSNSEERTTSVVEASAANAIVDRPSIPSPDRQPVRSGKSHERETTDSHSDIQRLYNRYLG